MSNPDNKLNSFLIAAENTVTRERLLWHRFCFDVYLAAAVGGYALQVLSIDVDREGFDVVLDDGDRERRIQLKAVGGQTPSWEVTKRLLRPEPLLAAKLGIPDTIEGIGIGGAIVVTEYDATKPDLDIRYLVCDSHLLAASANGWLPASSGITKGRKPGTPQTAQNVIDKLSTGIGSEKISIPKGLFVEARGPAELLALLELHSRSDHQWCEVLRKRLAPDYAAIADGPLEKEVAAGLELLIVI